MADSRYCYDGTTVLINKGGFKTQEKLTEFERFSTAVRQQELIESPLRGGFDLPYLCKIHKYLFKDVYDWAGKIRSVEIAKGHQFCPVRNIEAYANDIFTKLKGTDYLERSYDLVKELAFYLSEINALAPI